MPPESRTEKALSRKRLEPSRKTRKKTYRPSPLPRFPLAPFPPFSPSTPFPAVPLPAPSPSFALQMRCSHDSMHKYLPRKDFARVQNAKKEVVGGELGAGGPPRPLQTQCSHLQYQSIAVSCLTRNKRRGVGSLTLPSICNHNARMTGLEGVFMFLVQVSPWNDLLYKATNYAQAKDQYASAGLGRGPG